MVITIVLGFVLAIGKPLGEQLGYRYPPGLPQGIEVDIFPALNLPVIYVCQPYGGMDPAQMEGFLTNYYEYHFLYISGIHHVESRNIQGMSLMKLHFHPGTNMSQAMAETINYVNRSQAFMPPGTVSPFVMRFDTGSVPVGYLVLRSDTRSVSEINDLALFQVRPMFASLAGVSAPPPFGGSARTMVVSVDPDRLQSYGIAPEEVISAIARGNVLSPSGNIAIKDTYPIVPVNSVVKDAAQLSTIPVRLGPNPVFLRDLATTTDSADAPAGFALVNGRRAVYILATKRAEASTLSVINTIRKALPEMQATLPDDIQVSFEFDQSVYVTRSVISVLWEGLIGACLVGLMVLFFLWDWRSALIVILNIPLALMASVIGLWICGFTLNVMTLGGLALAIGILVDEATVEIENVHAQMLRVRSVPLAVRIGNSLTATPRLLALLCILAVFIPAFFLEGAAGGLFVPLATAVGFAMIASYVLSSTFVPVIAVWLLRNHHEGSTQPRYTLFDRFRAVFERIVRGSLAARWILVPVYLLGTSWVIWSMYPKIGQEIFPLTDSGAFRLRMRAPDGTHIVKSESLAKSVLDLMKTELGKDQIALSLGYVGMIHSNFPVNGVYQWSRGPEEAILYVALRKDSAIDVETAKERLRVKLAEQFPEVRFSFEPADIINEVMSFGSPAPIEVSVSGPDFAQSRTIAQQLHRELATIPQLRDLQFGQSLDYPTVEVIVDREKAALANITPADVAKSLVTATSSSRFTMPNYWADPKSGIAYQVQVEIPRSVVRTVEGVTTLGSESDLGQIPLTHGDSGSLRIRDVADIRKGTMPGQYDRYNMKRQLTLTANRSGIDLGSLEKQVQAAVKRLGELPKGVKVEIRGQLAPMSELTRGLRFGLVLSIVSIFLLLTGAFQSIRLALVCLSSVPAALCGVVLALWLTHSTFNVQSMVGAIMAMGVAMANAILLVNFITSTRRESPLATSPQALVDTIVMGSGRRLRAILMTSIAMIGGMLPMAFAWGSAGAQNAPLGRAVIGGLVFATAATLFLLPAIYRLIAGRAGVRSASLDPEDPQSPHFVAADVSQVSLQK